MIREFVGHNRPVNVVAFSPDGTKIVKGGDDVEQSPLRLWDVASGKEIYSLPRDSETKRDIVAQTKQRTEQRQIPPLTVTAAQQSLAAAPSDSALLMLLFTNQLGCHSRGG